MKILGLSNFISHELVRSNSVDLNIQELGEFTIVHFPYNYIIYIMFNNNLFHGVFVC
jgi:hypothetical protein